MGWTISHWLFGQMLPGKICYEINWPVPKDLPSWSLTSSLIPDSIPSATRMLKRTRQLRLNPVWRFRKIVILIEPPEPPSGVPKKKYNFLTFCIIIFGISSEFTYVSDIVVVSTNDLHDFSTLRWQINECSIIWLLPFVQKRLGNIVRQTALHFSTIWQTTFLIFFLKNSTILWR